MKKKLCVEQTKVHYCRFCAEKKQNNELLINFKLDDDIIKEIIDFTKNVQIDYLDISNENSLPKTLCNGCLNNIKAFNNFLSKVKQSQILLNNIYNITKEEINLGLENKDEDETESNSTYGLEYFDDTSNYSDEVASTKSHSKTFSKIQIQETIVPSKRILRSHKVTEDDISSQPTVKRVRKAQIIHEKDVDNSWTNYNWRCRDCAISFETMHALRTHKRTEHNLCFRFQCKDCSYKVPLFNDFIEHVRHHRPILRNYCEYCNKKFTTTAQCLEHTATHLAGREACKVCGKIMKDSKTLEKHNEYKKSKFARYPEKVEVKHTTLVLENGIDASWVDYDWSCRVCCQRLPDVDALRKHCQEVHKKCFAMKCMDCSMHIRNYESFVKHVRIHRPYLKKFCEYCNKNLKGIYLTQHVKTHKSKSNNRCPGCGQTFKTADNLEEHMIQHATPTVAESLVEGDFNCNVCRKSFRSLISFREHKKIHNTRTRDYTCDTCGATYMTLNTLRAHITNHKNKLLVCKVCKKTFSCRALLRIHVTIHLSKKRFKCNDCGAEFNRKDCLTRHMAVHSDVRPFKCKECEKTFRFQKNLSVHSRQHTGLRPYSCEFCDKTFIDGGNCNKHMLGKHGVSRSKKIKKQIPVDDATNKWVNKLVFGASKCI